MFSGLHGHVGPIGVVRLDMDLLTRTEHYQIGRPCVVINDPIARKNSEESSTISNIVIREITNTSISEAPL